MVCKPCFALLALNAAGTLVSWHSLRKRPGWHSAALRVLALAAGVFAATVAAGVFFLGGVRSEDVPVAGRVQPIPARVFPAEQAAAGVALHVGALAASGNSISPATAAASERGAQPGAAQAGETRLPGCALKALSPEGTYAALDLRGRPALFFASWCEHCGDALEATAALEPERRPYFVVYRPGVQGLPDAEREKMGAHGLAEEPLWAAAVLPGDVQALPALVWCGSSGLEAVTGSRAVADRLER